MISATANINLEIILNNLYVDIQECSLRHNITINVAISLVAIAYNGSTSTRTYTRSYNEQVPLDASNKKIAYAINKVLTNIIADMANDSETSRFMKKKRTMNFSVF